MLRFLPALVLLAAPCLASAADDAELYNLILQSKKHLTTIRSLGAAMLGLPHERENIVKELSQSFWVNQSDVNIGAAHREVAVAMFQKQLTAVESAVTRHELKELTFFGYTRHGSTDSIEIYFSADTASGPLFIRAAVSFAKDKARLFTLELFEGWEATRPVLRDIEVKATKQVLSVTYSPTRSDGDKP